MLANHPPAKPDHKFVKRLALSRSCLVAARFCFLCWWLPASRDCWLSAPRKCCLAACKRLSYDFTCTRVPLPSSPSRGYTCCSSVSGFSTSEPMTAYMMFVPAKWDAITALPPCTLTSLLLCACTRSCSSLKLCPGPLRCLCDSNKSCTSRQRVHCNGMGLACSVLYGAGQ